MAPRAKKDQASVSKTKSGSSKKSLQPSTIRIGRRYRSSRLDGECDAIVIGSGMGGLTTAAMLAKAGKKVWVFEQHYTAGGYTHSYSRNGYEWDVGVHYIGDMGSTKTPMRKLFDFLTEEELKWAPMDENYDRFHFGEDVYNLRAGKKNFIEDLVGYFPKERHAIEKYVGLLDQINLLIPLQVMDKMMPSVLGNPYRFLKKKLLPAYFEKTTYEVLSELTDDDKLISVLCGQYGDCGLPPKESSFMIHALIARHYLNGAFYPIGGASRIAETIIPVIQASGGEVFTYASVEEILLENGKATGVRMADGTEVKAPLVVSTGGVNNTFNKLLPEDVSRKFGYSEKLQQVKNSKAHLGVYIGLDASPEELDLPKTNFWIFPDYDAEARFEEYEADMSEEFPVVYISFPSAKDPSFAKRYPGKSTIEIVAPCPYDWFEKWENETWGKRGDAYEAVKEELGDRLLEKLYEKLPQLRGKIDYYEVSTPLSTNFFCAYQKGELYGLNHDPDRFKQDWLKPKTKIKGLYLSGQDILTCGIGGAMMAGVMTAGSILGWRSYKIMQQFSVRPSDLTAYLQQA